MKQTVGFIGLGAMGEPMARRLIDAGHNVVLWNRTREKSVALVDHGAREAETPAELARTARLVITCLLDTQAVEQVYLGTNGLLEGAASGSVFVEHGTFDPEAAASIAQVAAGSGASFLDAPVTGGRAAAESGSLVTMIGGSEEVLRGVSPVLASYCAQVVRVGGTGAGLRLKLVNQTLVSVHTAAAAEAAALITRWGIDPDVAQSVLFAGWADSAMLRRCLPLGLLPGDELETSAPIRGLREAQNLIAAAASEAAINLPVFSSASHSFEAAIARGWGDRDLSRLADLFQTHG